MNVLTVNNLKWYTTNSYINIYCEILLFRWSLFESSVISRSSYLRQTSWHTLLCFWIIECVCCALGLSSFYGKCDGRHPERTSVVPCRLTEFCTCGAIKALCVCVCRCIVDFIFNKLQTSLSHESNYGGVKGAENLFFVVVVVVVVVSPLRSNRKAFNGENSSGPGVKLQSCRTR